MKIGITGATGFVGRALVKRLVNSGHHLKCWYRDNSGLAVFDDLASNIEWIKGGLTDQDATHRLVAECDAVVHAAFWRPGRGFRGTEGDIVEFARVNILGTLGLIEASRMAKVGRFVFVSTCAVHEKILDDRPLDEAHPLWPLSHYGAHKAAIEKFVHSYGLGMGYPICAIRPTGIYGLRNPATDSKWFQLVSDIVENKSVEVDGGGKEVHVDDVTAAIEILLDAELSRITGESFACYDRYISRFEVAQLAKEMSASESEIVGKTQSPKHEIDTEKIIALGMKFGGTERLRTTIEQLINFKRNGNQVGEGCL